MSFHSPRRRCASERTIFQSYWSFFSTQSFTCSRSQGARHHSKSFAGVAELFLAREHSRIRKRHRTRRHSRPEDEALDLRHLLSIDTSSETTGLLGLSDSGSLIPTLDLYLNDDYDAGDPSPEDHANISNWATGVVKTGSASLSDIEEALVKAAIRQSNGNITKAASLLGISRAQMEYRSKKLEGA